MNRRTALLVFPALSLVFSASCASAQTHSPQAAGTTATTAPAEETTAPVAKSSATQAATADVMLGIRIAREQNAGYQRTKFRHWIDADGDSCNTREEVLIAESRTKAQVDPYGCKVIAGDWYSAYDGVSTSYPADLDIDHFVPLKEAWGSGAFAWTPAQRQAYANDLSDARALVAVTASSNRAKGDKDPPQWMPSNSAVTCAYLSAWVAVKARWSMTMDESEYRYVEKRLSGPCAGTPQPAWGAGTALASGGQSGQSNQPSTTGSTVAAAPASPATTVAKGSAPAAATVSPGAYCTPVGATGRSEAGKSYVCSLTNASGQPYSGGRAHWRPA